MRMKINLLYFIINLVQISYSVIFISRNVSVKKTVACDNFKQFAFNLIIRN